MGFVGEVNKKWKMVLSSSDIQLENPTKEEIIDLITASLPYREITSQLVRLAAHVVKVNLYKNSTTSWQTTLRDAALEIRGLNTRHKAKGVYFNYEDMHQMLKTKWNAVLSWVAQESNGQWSVSKLKKEVVLSAIWKEILKLKLDKRV